MIRVITHEEVTENSGPFSLISQAYVYEDHPHLDAYRTSDRDLQLGIWQDKQFRLLKTYAAGTWFSVEKIIEPEVGPIKFYSEGNKNV